MINREYTHSASSCVAYEVCEPLKPYRSKRAPKKIKTATVHKQYYPQTKKNKLRYVTGDRPVPWINLRGFWLAQAGFDIGSRYKIEVFENTLVLTVLD